MSIVPRSVRPRSALLQRLYSKQSASRSLMTEAQNDTSESTNIHISIFNKGFSYQPGIRKSFETDLSSAEISTQAAALRSSLGRDKASLRRSEKLIDLLKQQYDSSPRDKAASTKDRKATSSKLKKTTKSRREEKQSTANFGPRVARVLGKKEWQPLGSSEPSKFLRPASIAAVEDSEGQRNIEITASPAVNHPGLAEYKPVTIRGHVGESAKFNIPQTWLRDHCQCPECINPDTKQRQFNIFAFSEPPQIKKCSVGESRVKVEWKDNHKSIYSTKWLTDSFDVKKKVLERQGYVEPAWWRDDTAQNPPEVEFNDVMNPYDDKGLAEWMMKTRRYGFCFVNNTPPTPKATEDLLNRIGPIRNTHYGAFWDFTSNLAHKDTAYTDLALDVHTDTNYFTDSAGLQLFHLLSHEGTGGSSQLVDGFAVAKALYAQDRAAYDILAKVKMFYHSSGNEGLSIQPHSPFPVLVHDDVTHMLSQVRWNPYDKAAMTVEAGTQPAELVEEWYRAATLWDSMTKQDSYNFRYEFQLEPGRPLLFDNWRTLHGRSAFTGKRRMCGGYINRDDFISCFRTTNYGHGHILKHGIY